MWGYVTVAFLSGVMAVEEVQSMRAVDWSPWLTGSGVTEMPTPIDAPDPGAVAAVERHLSSLAGLGLPAADQGVWIQSGAEVLASHRGMIPTPAASLTKIPTTLASLVTWTPDYQFETLVEMQGQLQPDGVLQGNLVIRGGGDPLFVWEEAIALANALQARGIGQVTGDLIIVGDFSMNFQGDPAQSGQFLRQALDAARWPSEAATQFATLPTGTPRPQISIGGTVKVASSAADTTPLLKHRSLPLTQILKAMNIYSNNFIADDLARQLGGGSQVAQIAAEAATVPSTEIQLINGSGLGEENQISPRAVATMLMTIQARLQPYDLTVADFFPVVGRERGTLGGRQIVAGAAVKTGTLDRVSSLAGVIPTGDRPLVWFSLMDIGTGDLDALHRGQDRLLQSLVGQWGTADPLPPDLQPSDRLPSYQQELGNPARNESL